jgi:hypothetical protein
LPQPGRHTMLLGGGVAYWLSSPAAESEHVAPALAALRSELGAVLLPALMLMRLWRVGRAICGRARPTSPQAIYEEPVPIEGACSC